MADEPKRVLACPFCGGDAKLTDRTDNYTGDWMIGCDTQNCAGEGQSYDLKAEAIEAWNRRDPSAQAAARREAAVFKPTHRHYKGGLYEVLVRDVLHTETNEMLVIYRSAATVFARPQAMFDSEINGEPRFAALPTAGTGPAQEPNMTREEIEAHVHDLKAPYRTRDRMERQVTGAIELAFLRGYQAGQEDAARKAGPAQEG